MPSAKVTKPIQSKVTKTMEAAASQLLTSSTNDDNRILFTKTNATFGAFSNFSSHVVWMPIPVAALATPAAAASQSAAKARPLVPSDSSVAGYDSLSGAVIEGAGESVAANAAKPTAFTCALLPFQTSEHYFQAMKFPLGGAAFFGCVDAATPAITKKAGGNRSVAIRPDWNTHRHTVMMDVLRTKFASGQHPVLTQLLLSTGDKEIVEHAAWDKYWGDGGNGKGQNHLGKSLMRVRDELRKGSSDEAATSVVSPSANANASESSPLAQTTIAAATDELADDDVKPLARRPKKNRLQ